jgi:hypothetical protein
MSTGYLAFYKGNKSLTDSIIKWWTQGKYSHVEIAFHESGTEYQCYSSSIVDGGVRKKVIDLEADKWDLIPITISRERVQEYYEAVKDANYDVRGIVGFVIPFKNHNKSLFCVEFCGNLIGLDPAESWRFDPSGLYVIAATLAVK